MFWDTVNMLRKNEVRVVIVGLRVGDVYIVGGGVLHFAWTAGKKADTVVTAAIFTAHAAITGSAAS